MAYSHSKSGLRWTLRSFFMFSVAEQSCKTGPVFAKSVIAESIAVARDKTRRTAEMIRSHCSRRADEVSGAVFSPFVTDESRSAAVSWWRGDGKGGGGGRAVRRACREPRRRSVSGRCLGGHSRVCTGGRRQIGINDSSGRLLTAQGDC